MKKMIFLSVVMHFIILFVLSWYEKKTNDDYWAKQPMPVPVKPSLPTRVVESDEWQRIVESSPTSNLSKEDRADRARFLGERTQRVKEETRASGFGSSEGTAKADSPTKPRETLLESLGLASLWKLPVEGDVKEVPEAESELKQGTLDPLDPSISIGAQTILNTDEYVYASFFNRVKREVAPRWEPAIRNFMLQTLALVDGTYTTRYVFFLDAEGRLQDLELLFKSGSDDLDRIAGQALKDVAVFPNPPKALQDDTGQYRVELGFMVQYSKNKFRSEYLPDRRFQHRSR